MDFPRTRAIIDAALASGAFPAAAIDVGRAAGPLWQEAFGRLSVMPGAPASTADTIFDLASLTKVIATTSLVMRQITDGRWELDASLSDVLPGWEAPAYRAIRLRHLLDHSSGLPAHARLWEHATGRADYERALRALPLEHAPGVASVYSDPGFILLGFALEHAAGRPLDAQFAPLRDLLAAEIGYRPPDSQRDRIAPTEFDPWRGRLLVGEVHDENAAALGGVAGHAGLFGTAVAVGAFARLVLRTFAETTALGDRGLMRVFAARTGVPKSSRALGWDTMLPTSSCGARLSPTAIGHTGFTGTSLWIDWERDLYVVFLTNRVNPTRANTAIVAVRPRVHDSVVEEVGEIGSRSKLDARS